MKNATIAYFALFTCAALTLTAQEAVISVAFREDALIAQSENLSIPGLNPRGLPLTPAQTMELVTQYHQTVGVQGQDAEGAEQAKSRARYRQITLFFLK